MSQFSSQLPVCFCQAQTAAAELYLESMGFLARKEAREVPISLSYTEAQSYLNTFKAFDKDGDGHIRYTCVQLNLSYTVLPLSVCLSVIILSLNAHSTVTLTCH